MIELKIILTIFFFASINIINASFGDTDHYFGVCLRECYNKTKCNIITSKLEQSQNVFL